jgi:hypothetical protein
VNPDGEVPGTLPVLVWFLVTSGVNEEGNPFAHQSGKTATLFSAAVLPG